MDTSGIKGMKLTNEFTTRAEAAIERARTRAAELGAQGIRAANVLLSVLDIGSGMGVGALIAIGTDISALRRTLQRMCNEESDSLASPDRNADIPRAVGEEEIIKAASEEAHGAKIGTEHLLLAIASGIDPRVAAVLAIHGVYYRGVRVAIEPLNRDVNVACERCGAPATVFVTACRANKRAPETPRSSAYCAQCAPRDTP